MKTITSFIVLIISILLFGSTSQAQAAEYTIYTEDYTPLTRLEKDGIVGGLATEIVKQEYFP